MPGHGAFDPATRRVTIHATEFAFDAPDTITAGWTSIHLVNDGTQLHHVQLLRLDSGKTMRDLTVAFKNPGPPPVWLVAIGGPNAPDPKSQSDATVRLDPGNYAIVCMVDLGDHIPHVAKGMAHPLTVTANSGASGAAPASDVSVSLSDYAFAIDGVLTSGKHVVKVTNNGPQSHELELVRFADGKSIKDLAAWINKPDGPPPATAIGGVSAVARGGTNYASFDLVPGNYALICFIPDGKDGRAHIEHGMVKEIKIS
jgi:hypothetical protein